MIYYNDGIVLIRELREADAEYFAAEECAQGWESSPERYQIRLKDSAEGRCVALAAEYDGTPAGNINLYFETTGGPFRDKGYPVIVDLGVLEKFRRRGIGKRLMDMAEAIASERSDTVCLAVGLHDGYGAAQRLYAKRGYVPDGSGIWYGDHPAWAYDESYPIDDDLVMWMSKKLR